MKTLSNKNQKGFTLIELLVVIGILGVLMVGTLVALNPVQRFNQAKEANAKGNVDQASSAIQAYYSNNLSWPTSWNQLLASGELQSVPKGPDGNALTIQGSANGVAIGFTTVASTTAGSIFCWKTNGASGYITTTCTAP